MKIVKYVPVRYGARFFQRIRDIGAAGDCTNDLNLIGFWKRRNFSPPKYLEFNLAYADAMPRSSHAPTAADPVVLALHGTPGTHNDFKRLSSLLNRDGIRVISPNFPGMGWTRSDPDGIFQQSSEERAELIRDFLHAIGIKRVNLIMAHSSGCYTALRMLYDDPNIADGIVLINPGGMTPHKVLRPYWFIQAFAKGLEVGIFRFLMAPICTPLWRFCLKQRFPLPDIVWVSSIIMAGNIGFSQMPDIVSYIKALNTRLLLLYSEYDAIVESAKSEELASHLGINKLVVHPDDHAESSDECLREAQHHILNSGRCMVHFPKAGHFVHKKHPEILVSLMKAMVNR